MRNFINIINEAQASPLNEGPFATAAAAAAMAMSSPSAATTTNPAPTQPATEITTTAPAKNIMAIDKSLGFPRIILDIQEKVNRQIKFEPESGNSDNWQIPTRFGDCEDFALLKRKLLIEAGWPEDDLSLVIVTRPTEDGELQAHVVLVVRSLNNLTLDSPMEGDKSVVYPTPLTQWKAKGNWRYYCTVGDLSLGDHKSAVSKRCMVDPATGRKL